MAISIKLDKSADRIQQSGCTGTLDLSLPRTTLSSSWLSLTKITQALANQNPFGLEKHGPIFESFNDFHEEFKMVHQQFIHANPL